MKNFLTELFFGPFGSIRDLIQSIYSTFWHLAHPSITQAGLEAMEDPEKMKKINKALEEHEKSGNKITEREGIIIVEGGSYLFGGHSR